MITFSGYRPVIGNRATRFGNGQPDPDKVRQVEAMLQAAGQPPLDALKRAKVLLQEALPVSQRDRYLVNPVIPHLQGANILLITQPAFNEPTEEEVDVLMARIPGMSPVPGMPMFFDFAPEDLAPHRFIVAVVSEK